MPESFTSAGPDRTIMFHPLHVLGASMSKYKNSERLREEYTGEVQAHELKTEKYSELHVYCILHCHRLVQHRLHPRG